MALLHPYQYMHILNNDSGLVRMEIGPKRVVLKGNEKKLGSVRGGIVVQEDEYILIKNPYDNEQNKYLMGDRKVVVGPAVEYLMYNSKLETKKKIHVLSRGQAIRVQAIQTHEDKLAGEIWQVKGPCRFIPNKYTTVMKTINTTLINDGEGLYVQNVETSEKKLIEGPTAYLLDSNEDFFWKTISQDEKKALSLANASSYKAIPIYLKKGQVLCVLDSSKVERYVCGPRSVLLQHDEHVKVLSLAAGKPKQPYQIKAAVINLGPDFMSDRFEVRTKDNAHLSLLITYKWQFVVDDNQISKVFSMPDFIGYSCNTLTSLIREEVSKVNFEDFHSRSVGMIREALFKDHTVKDSRGNDKKYNGYFFEEIYFLVTEVDVKEVTPVNREINDLLNESIKNNMRIVCKKMMQDASLLAQKEKIKNDQELAGLKTQMIETENNNLMLETVGKAKIKGKVKILESTFAKKGLELKERAEQGIELERMRKIIELLQTPEGSKYLELIRTKNISNVNKTIYVASESKLKLW